MTIPPSKDTPDAIHVQDWTNRIAHLEQQVTALQAVQEAARSLTSELNLDQLLSSILQSAVEVMHASAGSLLLYDLTTNELVFEVVQGGGGEALRNKRIRTDQGIAGYVFTQRMPTVVQNVDRDDRFLSGFDAHFGFHTASLIAAPLIHKGNPIGVVEVLNKESDQPFTTEDQELLLAFASQSAVAIENARLYQQIVAERDRILAVEELIRRELARDLHDGPAQLISAVIMGLRFIREILVRKPERAQEELVDLEQLSTQALHQVRNMLFDLRPVLLETQGLRAALEAYAERQTERDSQLHLDLDSFTARFTPKAEAAIFSIVQEAVVNAKKHAAAKNIWIETRQQGHSLTILVRDDGRGFDVDGVEAAYGQRGSLGLLNMEERADIASAKLAIESEPGKGTLVTLSVPLAGALKR
ncbi:MAG: GAF domain-containing sensor histidine kinase [Chloroflexi bacterium]|nr:GAF domain-containing sensor histidine kinase [Chloroflexota bacterium]